MTEVLVALYGVACLADGFDDGRVGAINWGDGELEFVGEEAHGRQIFGPTTWEPPIIAFAQPLELPASPEYFFFLGVAAGDFNRDGADTLFYDPRELNGARYPYALARSDDLIGWDYVNAAPLSVPPGGTEPDAIIAILIGLLRQPVANAIVGTYDPVGGVLTITTTDAEGRFVLRDMDQQPLGTYVIVATGPGLPPQGYRQSFRLVEEGGVRFIRVDTGNM
jgi:hypothetical protein